MAKYCLGGSKMLSKHLKALTVVLLTLAVATPEIAVPAAAFLPAQVGSGGNSGLMFDNSNLFTEVGYNYRKRRNGYNSYYGGNRYSYRWYGHNNYHNGWRHHRHHNNYWPYYGGLAFGLGYGLGYGGGYGYYNDGYYGNRYSRVGGGHVQWCLHRYRSYNPRTDTFMGYDGYRHRCNSPYY
jgi:hypothetical protein